MNMSRFGARFSSLGKRFLAADRGASFITFSLGIIPIMLAAAIAVDYGRLTRTRSALQSAADTAALSAAQTAFQQLALGNPNWQTYAAQIGQNAFAASLNPSIGVVGAVTPTVTLSSNGANVTAQVQYTAQASTYLVNIAGFNGATILNTVVATTAPGTSSQTQTVPYVNVNLVLDVSPSMGIAATPTDIANMMAATTGASRGSCAFACHDNDVDSSPTYYAIARQNNITLRMDIVKTAAQSLTNYLINNQGTLGNFTMGLYTMSSTLQTLQAPTSSLASLLPVIGQVDFDTMSTVVYTLPAPVPANLASGDMPDRYGDSDFATTLAALAATVPAGAGGGSASSPQQVVVLVTDGLDDVGVATNSGVSATYSYPPVAVFPSGNSEGKITSPMDPNFCNALKGNGITVAVLYVTYVPQPTDPSGLYQALVETNAPPANLVSNLTACASSPNLMYQASDVNGISLGLQTLVNTAANLPQMAHLVR